MISRSNNEGGFFCGDFPLASGDVVDAKNRRRKTG
jgi:hypothetical protein